jgi:hypothetical protein
MMHEDMVPAVAAEVGRALIRTTLAADTDDPRMDIDGIDLDGLLNGVIRIHLTTEDAELVFRLLVEFEEEVGE